MLLCTMFSTIYTLVLIIKQNTCFDRNCYLPLFTNLDIFQTTCMMKIMNIIIIWLQQQEQQEQEQEQQQQQPLKLA